MERNLRKERVGIVSSNKMDKSMTVVVKRKVKHPVYGKFMNKSRKFLAHDESTLVWHDYSYFPEEIRYEVMAAILDGTDPVDREQLFFVSRTKCAIFLRSKIYDLG